MKSIYYLQVQEVNLYHDGDQTSSSQILTEFNLQRCWNELMAKVKYEDRVAAVEKFNKSAMHGSHKNMKLCTYRNNNWKKRGIAMTPTKFGVCVPPPLCQVIL